MTHLAQLEALAKLREKATPGPWRNEGRAKCTCSNPAQHQRVLDYDGAEVAHVGHGGTPVETGAFIAAAGTIDLPALVRYVRALEHVVEVARTRLRLSGERFPVMSGPCDNCGASSHDERDLSNAVSALGAAVSKESASGAWDGTGADCAG